MNSIVCIKRVPDTEAKIKIDDSGMSVVTTDLKHVVNPYDEYALEQAVRLKEAHGGEVLVICLGRDEAGKEIRQALAIGADRAIFLKDEQDARDSLGIARAVVEAIREDGFEFDALLLGKRAVDTEEGAVGQMIAHLLELPCVTNIDSFDYDDGEKRVVAKRTIEGGEEVIEVALPAVFTCDKSLNEPRYASLKGIMAAKRKPLDTSTAFEVEPKLELVKIVPPPERATGQIVGEGKDAVPELVKKLREEAKVI